MLVNLGDPTDAQCDGELLAHQSWRGCRGLLVQSGVRHLRDGVLGRRLPAGAASTPSHGARRIPTGNACQHARVRRADGVAVIGVAIQTNRFETTGQSIRQRRWRHVQCLVFRGR